MLASGTNITTKKFQSQLDPVDRALAGARIRMGVTSAGYSLPRQETADAASRQKQELTSSCPANRR